MKVLVVISVILSSYIEVLGQNNAVHLGFKITSENRKKVDIPFETHNHLIVIPIILNDRLPLKFILDTGVRTAILTDRSISDYLNMNYTRKRPIYGAGGEKIIDAYIANDVTIELPGVRGSGHALFVLEEDFLRLRNYLGIDVHGIIGYELFSRFVVEINYAKKVVTIHDPKYFKPKRKYKSIPITVEDTKPYILADVGIDESEKIQVKLMVDTGASHSILLLSDTDKRIKVPDQSLDSYLGRGLSGDIEGKVARINSFDLGEYKLEKPIAVFPNPESYPDSLNSVERNGTIGGALTSRFNVVFDFFSENLYIKKNNSFKKPFDFNLSGVVIIAKGRGLNTFEVVEVRKNSAGDKAGIQVGDIIKRINNHYTNDMNLGHVTGYFNSKHRRTISITLEREGKSLVKVIKLKRLI